MWIVVGTQTLTALEVAERLQGYLKEWGYPSRLVFAEELRPAELAREERAVFCLSTWCWTQRPKTPTELLPQGAAWLYERLRAGRPDLSRLRYGICALGERAYGPYFCKVEVSSSYRIYREPKDAYTKALLSAIPIPDPSIKRECIPWNPEAYLTARQQGA